MERVESDVEGGDCMMRRGPRDVTSQSQTAAPSTTESFWGAVHASRSAHWPTGACRPVGLDHEHTRPDLLDLALGVSRTLSHEGGVDGTEFAPWEGVTV